MADEKEAALDLNSRTSVEKEKKKLKEQRRNELEDLRILLALPAGRRVFFKLLEKSFVLYSLFHESPALMQYRAGWQDFGNALLRDLESADYDLTAKMRKEGKNA